MSLFLGFLTPNQVSCFPLTWRPQFISFLPFGAHACSDPPVLFIEVWQKLTGKGVLCFRENTMDLAPKQLQA